MASWMAGGTGRLRTHRRFGAPVRAVQRAGCPRASRKRLLLRDRSPPGRPARRADPDRSVHGRDVRPRARKVAAGRLRVDTLGQERDAERRARATGRRTKTHTWQDRMLLLQRPDVLPVKHGVDDVALADPVSRSRSFRRRSTSRGAGDMGAARRQENHDHALASPSGEGPRRRRNIYRSPVVAVRYHSECQRRLTLFAQGGRLVSLGSQSTSCRIS